VEAQPEPFGLQPGGECAFRCTFDQPPVRQHPHLPRHALAPGGSQQATRVAPVVGKALERPVRHRFGEHEISWLGVSIVERQTGRVGLEPIPPDEDAVVLLAADATEGERGAEVVAAGPRFGREAALGGGLERGVEGVALRDELVELEGEERLPVGTAETARRLEKVTEAGLAEVARLTSEFGEFAGDRTQRARRATAERAVRL